MQRCRRTPAMHFFSTPHPPHHTPHAPPPGMPATKPPPHTGHCPTAAATHAPLHISRTHARGRIYLTFTLSTHCRTFPYTQHLYLPSPTHTTFTSPPPFLCCAHPHTPGLPPPHFWTFWRSITVHGGVCATLPRCSPHPPLAQHAAYQDSSVIYTTPLDRAGGCRHHCNIPLPTCRTPAPHPPLTIRGALLPRRAPHHSPRTTPPLPATLHFPITFWTHRSIIKHGDSRHHFGRAALLASLTCATFTLPVGAYTYRAWQAITCFCRYHTIYLHCALARGTWRLRRLVLFFSGSSGSPLSFTDHLSCHHLGLRGCRFYYDALACSTPHTTFIAHAATL